MRVDGGAVDSGSWTGSARTGLKAEAGLYDVRGPLPPRKSVFLTGKPKKPSRGNSWEFGYLFTNSFPHLPLSHQPLPPSLPSFFPSIHPSLSH